MMLWGMSTCPDISGKTLGWIGEVTTWRALESSGYKVVNGAVAKQGDLQVVDVHGELRSVEVKTAKRSRDGLWRWCLVRTVDGRTCTDYRHSDVLVLLAILEDGQCVPFVMPVAALRQRNISMRDPMSKRSKWARWRQGDVLTLESPA